MNMTIDVNAKTQILELWLKRMKVLYPEIKSESKLEILDHLPEFLDRLFAALRKEEYHSEVKEMKKVSRTHGRLRAEMDAYSIAQVLREYSVLRIAIIEILDEKSLVKLEDRFVVHKFIDEAQIVAGTEFAESRSAITEELNAELKRSNRDLERFAAVAAHDLRSPLATIIGYKDIIQDEIKNPSENLKTCFKFMQSSAGRMLVLIERLLAYAKLGQTETKVQNVDLKNIVSDVMVSLNDPALGLNVVVDCGDLPTIMVDPSLAHQLFQNLIGNSIKFRGDKIPQIKIYLKDETDEEWTIVVEDNGIGFDNEHGESIFEPFKRLNHASDYQGTGLGLATVRRVVDILGGTIWAESEIGKGAKFIFTISKENQPKDNESDN